MPKKGHSEEQILRALQQAESGTTTVREICRGHGISDATFYIWKKKYAGLGLSELRELRQLREENGKLKRLVADLSLDRHILQEIVQKSCKASPAARARAMDAGRLRPERTSRGEADEHHAQDFALPDPAPSAGRPAHAPARTGSTPSALRVSTADGDLEERGSGG
jgi:putative transposase